MGDRSLMPQLCEDAAALGMDCVRYLPPGITLLTVVDAGGAVPSLTVLAYPSTLTND